MYSLEEELDTLVAQVAGERVGQPLRPRTRPCGPGCSCSRCTGAGCQCSGSAGNEASRRRRPPVARRQTSVRAVGTQLPGWRGWSPPERLSDILQATLSFPHNFPLKTL